MPLEPTPPPAAPPIQVVDMWSRGNDVNRGVAYFVIADDVPPVKDGLVTVGSLMNPVMDPRPAPVRVFW